MNKILTVRQVMLMFLVIVIIGGVLFNWVLNYNLKTVDTRIHYIEMRISKEISEYDTLTSDLRQQLDDFTHIFSHDMIRNLQDLRYSYSRSRKQMESMEAMIKHIRLTKHNLNMTVAEFNQFKQEFMDYQRKQQK